MGLMMIENEKKEMSETVCAFDHCRLEGWEAD